MSKILALTSLSIIALLMRYLPCYAVEDMVYVEKKARHCLSDLDQTKSLSNTYQTIYAYSSVFNVGLLIFKRASDGHIAAFIDERNAGGFMVKFQTCKDYYSISELLISNSTQTKHCKIHNLNKKNISYMEGIIYPKLNDIEHTQFNEAMEFGIGYSCPKRSYSIHLFLGALDIKNTDFYRTFSSHAEPLIDSAGSAISLFLDKSNSLQIFSRKIQQMKFFDSLFTADITKHKKQCSPF